MANQESQDVLSTISNEPPTSLNDKTEKTDEVFRVPAPVNSSLKKKRMTLISSKKPSNFWKFFSDKQKKHSNKSVAVEKASDKNIATLLRSERLFEYIQKGLKIPHTIGLHISQKTGFTTVHELNKYISAHRKKFMVLVDRKAKHCQIEDSQCNNTIQRADSVDLRLYLEHHYSQSPTNTTS